MTAMIKAAGRNLAALIGLFAVFLPAFIVCTTLFSAGAGMIVIVRRPVRAGRLPRGGRLVGPDDPRAARVRRGRAAADPLPGRRAGLRGTLRRLGHAQSWRDLLHVLVGFVLARSPSRSR